MEGRGLISMKHAAVRAGLGTLGKNTLLLNRDVRQSAEHRRRADGSGLAVRSACGERLHFQGCTKCVDSCPSGAIQNGTVVQKLCRAIRLCAKNGKGITSTTECNALPHRMSRCLWAGKIRL